LHVFFLSFGLAYVAATLLATGVSHVWRFSSFRMLVRAHKIVPASLVLPAAACLVVYELVAGGLAAGLLIAPRMPVFAMLVFVSCVLAGAAFWLYVRRLLNRPVRSGSCGCLPVSSPLTSASLTPSASLAIVSLTGLAATALGSAAEPAPLGVVLLAALWGVTLAGLLVLFPAAVPAAVGGDRW
jgi:hypothetical protein